MVLKPFRRPGLRGHELLARRAAAPSGIPPVRPVDAAVHCGGSDKMTEGSGNVLAE